MSITPSILVVDDDPGVVAWLVESLEEEGFRPFGETSAERALDRIRERAFDVVVSDVEMPGMRGTELLRAILRVRPKQSVLLVTAFGSIDLAVEAVRSGAADFIAKPFRLEVLVLALRRAMREREMRREILRLREAALGTPTTTMAARSAPMQRVLDVARRAARSLLPVLVTGESGVGKSALARFIHGQCIRAEGRFVQLNCAALPAGIAEAELFGVRRGAFTDAREDRPGVFEQAHEGTLFLDEIGELPMDLQPKLLQALESNRVRPLGATTEIAADARIVAATNRSLEDAIAERRFRPDLFHRLNVVRIEIPPLRERPDDIDLIVDQVLAEMARRAGMGPLVVAPEAMRALRSHPWPGNVRELMNALQRAAALADGDVLTPDDFELRVSQPPPPLLDVAADTELSLAEVEAAYIRRVLHKTNGHKGNAARILGLDRRTLYRKVADLEGGLERRACHDGDSHGGSDSDSDE